MSCVNVSAQDLLSCGQGATPGLAGKFYYALVRQLTKTPVAAPVTAAMTLVEAATAVAAGTYTFITGGKFGVVSGVNEASFEDPLDGGKRQKTVKPKYSAKVNRSIAAEGFRELYKNEELIIVFKDANGKWRQLGNLDFPAFFANADGMITDTEASMNFAFEAMIKQALVLPDNIVLSTEPAV